MVYTFRRACCALVFGTAAIAPAGFAHADELDLSAIVDIEDLALADLLERDVVSASRYAQRPGDSPTLVSTIDAEAIAQLGYRTINEALRGMRGVYTSNDRNYAYVGIRGFNVLGDYSTRLSLTIDNHRVNDPVYGQAPSGLELGLPIAAVERLELIRGGAWSVHGQSALLGAIQVVTASGATRPGLRLTTTARGTLETYDDPADRPIAATRGADLAATYGLLSGGIDVFAAAAYTLDPGLRAFASPAFETADETCVDRGGRPRACDGVFSGGDREEVTSAYLAVRTAHLEAHALVARRSKRIPTAPYYSIIGDPVITTDDRAYADVAYKRPSRRSDLIARIAVDYYGFAGRYPYDNPGDDGALVLPESRVVNHQDDRGYGLSAELRGRYKWPRLGTHLTDLELAAGGEAGIADTRRNNHDVMRDGSLVPYFNRTTGSRTAALTGHASARAFAHLVGFAAVRADYQADSFGVIVNPQGGVVLDGGARGRLRASISRGFRGPNAWERSEPAYPLAPERSETRELSVERYLGKHLRLQLVGFDQRMTDLIVLTDVEGFEDYAFVNQGAVRTRGLEGELEGRWDRVQVRGHLAIQRGEDQDGERPLSSPGSVAGFTLIAPIASGRADVSVESFYVGSLLAYDRSEVPAYFTSNLTVRAPAVADGLDLALGISNVFDERGVDPVSDIHRQTSVSHDPRTIWVRLGLSLEP